MTMPLTEGFKLEITSTAIDKPIVLNRDDLVEPPTLRPNWFNAINLFCMHIINIHREGNTGILKIPSRATSLWSLCSRDLGRWRVYSSREKSSRQSWIPAQLQAGRVLRLNNRNTYKSNNTRAYIHKTKRLPRGAGISNCHRPRARRTHPSKVGYRPYPRHN